MRIEHADGLLTATRTALAAGHLCVVPTDTVYGLAAAADDPEACARLYEAKHRPTSQPIAIAFGSVEELLERLPGLSDRTQQAVLALLPGPYTLIAPNPDGAYRWVCGDNPQAIGVRVPEGSLHLPPIAATSANRPGKSPAATVGDLDASLAAVVAVAIDAGRLDPAQPSTVLDLTAWEAGGDVQVVRDPALRGDEALEILAALPPN